MIPTHVTIDYHHAGCCAQLDGHLVTITESVDPETGTYAHVHPYCAYTGMALRRMYAEPQRHYGHVSVLPARNT